MTLNTHGARPDGEGRAKNGHRVAPGGGAGP
jgi:hypothetical protein